jgi:AraC-like DNA-binding protein
MPASLTRADAPPSTRFDTGRVPEAARLDFWNRINSENFSRISVDPRGASLRGVLERCDYGALSMAHVQSTAVTLHGGQLSTPGPRPGGGLLLHLQEAGTSLNRQLERTAILRAGDFTFCDAERPYLVKCDDPVSLIVVRIPCDLLVKRFGSVDELVALHVDGTRGGGAILGSLVRNAWRHRGELAAGPAGAGDALMSAVLDLMALIQRSATEPAAAAGFGKLQREMGAYIEGRLADPDLSVGSVADAFGMTPRHVHRVFAESGTTPSNYIRERRLTLAAARLRDAEHDSRVTDIALDLGFSDSTSFCRMFRKRYGVAPGDYRRERRGK